MLRRAKAPPSRPSRGRDLASHGGSAAQTGAVLTILKSVHAGCHANAVDFQPPVRPSTAWGARRLEAPLRLLPAIAVAIVVALVKLL